MTRYNERRAKYAGADAFGTPDFGDPELAEEKRRHAKFTEWFWSVPRTRRELIYWGIEYPAAHEYPTGWGLQIRNSERPDRDHGHIGVVGLSEVLERQQREKLQPKKEEKREMWDGLF